jgi:hypothetical protein
MQEINDVIVHDGTIVLNDLPFVDGQHVRMVVVKEELDERPSIEQVRQVLRGHVERFDDPVQPMIPDETWEMLK